jgi:hypothetical protein
MKNMIRKDALLSFSFPRLLELQHRRNPMLSFDLMDSHDLRFLLLLEDNNQQPEVPSDAPINQKEILEFVEDIRLALRDVTIAAAITSLRRIHEQYSQKKQVA